MGNTTVFSVEKLKYRFGKIDRDYWINMADNTQEIKDLEKLFTDKGGVVSAGKNNNISPQCTSSVVAVAEIAISQKDINNFFNSSPDLIIQIFSHINDGKTYKNTLYSCKYFYEIMTVNYPRKKHQVYNLLWSLLLKNIQIKIGIWVGFYRIRI